MRSILKGCEPGPGPGQHQPGREVYRAGERGFFFGIEGIAHVTRMTRHTRLTYAPHAHAKRGYTHAPAPVRAGATRLRVQASAQARACGGGGSHQVEVSAIQSPPLTPSRGEWFSTPSSNKCQQVSTSVNNYQVAGGMFTRLDGIAAVWASCDLTAIPVNASRAPAGDPLFIIGRTTV